MSRSWFGAFALLTVLAFSLAQYILSNSLIVGFRTDVSKELESTFKAQTLVLGDLIRNDILSGNMREARNKLAKAVVNSPVLGCVVTADDGSVREDLIGPSGDSPLDPDIDVEIPILFSKDGPRWGTLNFNLDSTRVTKALVKLQDSLQKAQLLALLFVIGMIAILHAFLFRSGQQLERHLQQSLLGSRKKDPKSFFARIWEPVMTRMDSVAAQFNAVNMVTQQVEEEKSRSEGVTQIIHDLKAPISALKIGMPAAHFKTADHEQLVHSALQRLDEMVSESLLSSRGADGRVPIQRVNLKDFLNAVESELRLQLDTQVIWDSESENYISNVNSQELSQIVINLAKNSREADATQLTILLKQTPSINYLIIADNGRGIPKYVLEKIGRVPVTVGKGEAGSGQGIYGAFRTIKSWGGTIKFASEEGKGTQTVIALPRA